MKKLRKALLGAFAAFTVLCAATAFAACGGAPHEHVWSEWTEKTPATCTAAKVEERNCTSASCTGGGHEERTVGDPDPSNHSWEEDFTVDTPATCTTDGSKSVHCASCTETKDVTVIPASHSWEEDFTVDTPANCTTDGSKSIHCASCGETKDATVITASHEWSEWTEKTAATCTAAKVEERNCNRADCEEHEERTVGEPLGHSWGESGVVTVPTGTKTGKAAPQCLVCGATDDENAVTLPKLTDASYVKTEDTATCALDGFINYTYTEGGKTFSFDIDTRATGNHTVAEWTTTADPTCGAAGAKSGHCSVCDDDVTGSIPATGKHTPTNPYNYCSVCKEYVDYVVRVTGNTPTINFTVNPGEWCTVNHLFMSPGYVVYTYTGETPVLIWYSTSAVTNAVQTATLNNGDTFYLKAASRGTGYMAIKTNSAETVTGKITGKWQSAVPAMPTKLELGDKTVNASQDSDSANTLYEFTATAAGTNGYVLYCEEAGAVIMKKSNATAEYDEELSLPYAFTLAEGEKISIQTLVGFGVTKTSYKITLVMGEPHEHVWGEWTEKTAATCTTAKVEQRSCTDANCPSGARQEQSAGEPLGHAWSEWTEKTPATCTTAKVEERSCSRCGTHEEQTAGEAAGHSLTETAATPATCTADGREAYWTCSKCGKLYSDANGTTEITAPVAIPAGHSYAFEVTESKITNKCTVCGDEKSSNEFDNKVQVNGTQVSTPVTVSSGTNLVCVNRETNSAATLTYWISFTADKTGTYRFEFTHISDYATAYRQAKVDGSGHAATPVREGTASTSNILSVTIELVEDEVCTLQIGNVLPVEQNFVSYYLVTPVFVEAEA